ncbi:MAG: hypothetical protein AAGB35_05130 [Pseudomonadota bacterium]
MNTQIQPSPITQELYSIDWSKRFDEYRKSDDQSFNALNSLIAKVERFVEKELKNRKEDLDDIKKLKAKFNRAQADSTQWHCLSILINIKIIREAMPKGLTHTATLSAIQIMEHMWKVLAANEEMQSVLTQSVKQEPVKTTEAKSTASKTAKTKTDQKSEKNKPTLANYTSRTRNSDSDTKAAKTENVVIKKLAADAGSDDNDSLAQECYEVACALAEEYPEYTLTAIRVMTAEKLGVTRQFIDNLDIRPDRFKNAS